MSLLWLRTEDSSQYSRRAADVLLWLESEEPLKSVWGLRTFLFRTEYCRLCLIHPILIKYFVLSSLENTKMNGTCSLSSWTSKYKWGDEAWVINDSTEWGSRYRTNTNSGWSQEKFYQRFSRRPGRLLGGSGILIRLKQNKRLLISEMEQGKGNAR